MERLQTDIAAMIKHVEGLPGTPTMEQLVGKVKSLSAAIMRDANSLPYRIKEIVFQGFATMGYDVRRHRVMKSAEFTSEGLLVALRVIESNIKNWSPPVNPTAEELGSLSAACDRLWDLDGNRLVPDVDYAIDLQRGKKAYDKGDYAADPLFAFVDEKALARPTFAAFIALLDNYIAKVGQTESVTAEELAENHKFLELIMDTAVMQYLHRYLLLTQKSTANSREEFIRELHELWFGLYSRKARNDSSGFEHVFLGEVKEGSLSGFHNWMQLYLEEKKQRGFDYKGYIKPRRRAHGAGFPDSRTQLITIQFEWQGAVKSVSSSLIGVSPEFEIALYTLCFYTGGDKDIVQLGPYKAEITCYRWPAHPHKGQKIHLATAFPGEAPLDEDEAATRIQSHSRSRQSYKKHQQRKYNH